MVRAGPMTSIVLGTCLVLGAAGCATTLTDVTARTSGTGTVTSPSAKRPTGSTPSSGEPTTGSPGPGTTAVAGAGHPGVSSCRPLGTPVRAVALTGESLAAGWLPPGFRQGRGSALDAGHGSALTAGHSSALTAGHGPTYSGTG
ncbi:MAG: hypothetical protein ACRD0J_00660, partial [Acidimicrobiales bacterium]